MSFHMLYGVSISLSICHSGAFLSFFLRFAGWDASSVGVSVRYCNVNHATLVKLKDSENERVSAQHFTTV